MIKDQTLSPTVLSSIAGVSLTDLKHHSEDAYRIAGFATLAVVQSIVAVTLCHEGEQCPHGSYVVTGSEDATAKIWDVATGAELRSLVGHSHTGTHPSSGSVASWSRCGARA